jgi:hypothetical protein
MVPAESTKRETMVAATTQCLLLYIAMTRIDIKTGDNASVKMDRRISE